MSGENNNNQDIPEPVKAFFRDLTEAVRNVKVLDIRQLYDTTFNQLTVQYFKIDKNIGSIHRQWPSPSAVSSYFLEDPVSELLYKELFYRYQYQLKDIPDSIRVESWENYNNLFTFTLSRMVVFDLPQSWLWDIMDEFIYQTITNCLCRKRDRNLWNPATVICILETIVDKSGVRNLLKSISAGEASSACFTEYGPDHVLRMMGYNAMIMLLRVHTQMGDYYTALQVIEGSDLQVMTGDRSGVYNAVPACYMTLHYYAGFCCMMLRRYRDAQVLLTNSLRCKNYHIMSYQQQVITTLIRQAQFALQIVNLLCPQRFDIFREEDLQGTDEETFVGTFKKACPKFITPYFDDQSADASFKLMQSHCNLLYREVQQQECIPSLRSYLRLYDDITLSKLSSLQSDSRVATAEDVTRNLLCWKHKAEQLSFTGTGSRVSTTGHSVRGNFRPSMGGVDFSIVGENVKVNRLENTEGAVTSSGNANTIFHLLREHAIVKEMEEALESCK